MPLSYAGVSWYSFVFITVYTPIPQVVLCARWHHLGYCYRLNLKEIKLNAYLRKIVSANGDSTQQVTDLIVFLGYFSVCLYAGGITYNTSYYSYYSLTENINPEDTYYAIEFVVNVLVTGWYWVLSSLYLLFFILIYYSCRYAWKPWFGYFVLSLLLYTTFLICGVTGEYKGYNDAVSDAFKDSTTKPIIKIYGANNEIVDFLAGNLHLLGEDDHNFFVFEPAGVKGSVLQIHIISKANIKHYEVIVK